MNFGISPIPSSGFTPSPGGASASQISSNVKSILNALSISPSNVTVATQKGGQATLQNGLSFLVQLPISASQAHQLQQLGLVTSQVQLALAIKGSETVQSLRKHLKDLEDDVKFSDQLGEITSFLGIPSQSDAMLLVEESGGIVLVEQSIQEIKAR